MKKVYGYIRVSTQKQGDGVSLEVQKSDIKLYAKRKGIKIIQWFEEKKSASKGYRPQFNQMIEKIYNNEADGFVAHKIDRMMRNRHDWAVINDLIDRGHEVISADGTTLDDVNGRFMGDIQAAVATRYSSNLSQEAKKGLYGRLKQGYYPWKAPIGYEDNGKGKVKSIHPVQGKLVQELFTLYVSEDYNVKDLAIEMEKRGLRNSRGNRVCKNGILLILKNPFYIGIMRVKGKSYNGNHKTLIDSRTFKQAQMILQGRRRSNRKVHNYLFRQMVKCEHCNYFLYGEQQKGHMYYRCHTKNCITKTIREDVIEQYVENVLKLIALNEQEYQILKAINIEVKADGLEAQEKILSKLRLDKKHLEEKEQRLLDAYLDNMLDKVSYQEQKDKIVYSLQSLSEQQKETMHTKDGIFTKIDNLLELCKSPLNSYKSGIREEKREMLKIIVSNLTVDVRKASFIPISPYRELAFRDFSELCALNQDTHRTMTCKIVYMDKNTCPVLPKAMNEEQLRVFYEFLLSIATKLQSIQSPKEYEV